MFLFITVFKYFNYILITPIFQKIVIQIAQEATIKTY